MHDRHAGSEIGEEQRLLDRGIAAADHQHLLAAIEEAVASGAGGNAVALEFLLGRQLQPTRLGAGRDDEAVCEVMVAGLALDPERPVGKIDLAHMIADELGPDVLGLLLHLLHQPGPLDDVCEAGVVLDVGRDGELATGLDALDQDRLQHGAGGIDRGRIARRPGPDDEELGALDLSPREQTPAGALRQSARGKGESRCCTAIKLCRDARSSPLTVRGSGSPRRPIWPRNPMRAHDRVRMRIDAPHNLWVPGSYARYADQNATML